MLTFLKRFLLIEHMLRPQQLEGPLPDNGTVYRRTLKIAWPAAFEMLMVSLITAVDVMMVGSLGPEAIAAVGITQQPRLIVLSVVVSLNIGVTAMIARNKGAQNRDGANRCLKQGLLLCFAIALVMALAALLGARPLLIFIGAGQDYLELALNYFRIILFGNFFASLSLTINASQRGIGNTKLSLRTNLIANLVNLVFNYLLIFGIGFFPALGVVGAAIATVLGNLTAFVLSLFSVLSRSGYLNLKHRCPWRLDPQTTGSIFNIGGSALLEQMFLRIGMLSYVKLVAGLGTLALATHQIGMNLLNLSFSLGDGLSIAAASLVGQSIGARRMDLAIIYGKVGQRFALSVGLLLFLIFATLGQSMVALFTQDPSVMVMSRSIVIMVAATSLVQTSQVVFTGCLRGAGDTRYVAMLALSFIAFVRPFSSWLFCYPLGLGLVGAWLGLFLDQSLRLFMTHRRFSSGRWVQNLNLSPLEQASS